MSKLCRYLVAGSRTFNNYFIFYRQLHWYLPKHAIIVNGGADGADQLAAVYAECNGYAYEAYPADWTRFGKNADVIRNRELSKMVAEAIFFWDGVSPSTKQLIEFVKQRGIQPLVIPFTKSDIVRPHPDIVKMCKREPFDIYIGRGHGSLWGNPYAISDTRNREYVISMFTDYLLKKPTLLKNIFQLRNKTLGCHCAPELCHGDMLVWMLEHAESEIKSIIKEEIQEMIDVPKDEKNDQENIQDLSLRWRNYDSGTQVGTRTNLCIATDYTSTIIEGSKCYLAVFEKDIYKKNLYLTRQERERQESDPDKTYYKPVDGSKCEIFFCNKSFGDSLFKVGMWYINAQDVVPLKV